MDESNFDKQIKLLQDEAIRAKMFVNENQFDCTSAIFYIVQNYRKELKQQINNLLLNQDY